MTRRFILTSAALAAFLAAGTTLAGATPPLRRSKQAMDLVETRTAAPTVVTIGGNLVAVHTAGEVTPGGVLGVALFVEPENASIQLWAGNKNGWGSIASRTEPVPGVSGLHVASVAIPEIVPEQARLWIGIDRADGRPLKGSVALEPV